MRCTLVKSRIEQNKEILMIKINTITSIKTKVVSSTVDLENDKNSCEYCTACLSFDARSKQVLHYPYSTCGCYDGRHFSSHLLSFLLFFRCAKNVESNCEEFEKSIPENPVLLHNVITLIENVVDLQKNE